ncbi:MAG: diacylglycerol kinase [Planctomycetes bacterium]|nr:diacylglycerol kinase [Planctomycetota bacterium]
MIGFVVLTMLLLLIRWPAWKTVAMLGVYLLIPMMEIVNSALENICDRITDQKDEAIQHAKDKGALAVLAAIVINAIVMVALFLV